jgi:hypothetical protein
MQEDKRKEKLRRIRGGKQRPHWRNAQRDQGESEKADMDEKDRLRYLT